MATKYADRAYISIQGTRIADVQSASLKRNRNARAVNTMTRDGFNKGFVQGNTDFDISLSLAVQNRNPRPKLDDIDYEANDVQLTFEVGADIYICTGLFLKDSDDNAGGVGDEVKASLNFGCLKAVDATGNGILFDLAL